jgi:hypothetical protein
VVNDDPRLCSACLVLARRVPATYASRYGGHYAYCAPHAGDGDQPLVDPAPDPLPQPPAPMPPTLVSCPRCGAQRAVNHPCVGCAGWKPRTRKATAS